jgi:hypothetical protein
MFQWITVAGRPWKLTSVPLRRSSALRCIRRASLVDRPAGRALALATLLLGGCSLFTTRSGPATGFVPYVARPVPGTDLFDFKGVVHVHSFLSHDSRGTVAQIGAAADACGIDFLVMTDHATPHSVARGRRGMVGRTLFLVGAEIRAPGGTLLGFPLRHYVRPQPTLAATAEAIRAQGGLVFAAHVEREFVWDGVPLDGVEIVNLHAAALAAPTGSMLFQTMFTPLRATLALLTLRVDAVLAAWDACLARGVGMTPIGGNDAHANVDLLVATIGTYEEIFGVLSTHVLARELSEAAIVDALRAGRNYVVFDLHRDATGFDFRARDGTATHLPGSTVRGSASLELVVMLPAPATIHLLHDGRRVRSAEGVQLVEPTPAPGVWRVEVELSSGRPWIYSSWIRIAPP